MIKEFFGVAYIEYGKAGVVIDALTGLIRCKHYNVTVTKVDDVYRIEAEAAQNEWFLDPEYNPTIVDTVIDEHVEITKKSPLGWAFGVGGKRYVHGYCELKEREKVTLITNNITIKK
jgi:hypothetical protein